MREEYVNNDDDVRPICNWILSMVMICANLILSMIPVFFVYENVPGPNSTLEHTKLHHF